MRRMIGAALALWTAAAGMAGAEAGAPVPVVVELYTSQGCSSCPPADAVLMDLARRPGVIALALHVDYWDYIGWKDTFARPAFSVRQRAYAQAAGAQTVYTPQLIVAGREHTVGARQAEIEALIARHATEAPAVALDLRRSGDSLHLVARAERPLPDGAVVQLVRYRPLETVEIAHGENAGRRVEYANIVTSWQAVSDWDGKGELALDLAAPGTDPAVVILQAPGPGAILAAAEAR